MGVKEAVRRTSTLSVVLALVSGCAGGPCPKKEGDLRALTRQVTQLQDDVAAVAQQVKHLREQQKQTATKLVLEQRTYLAKLTTQLEQTMGGKPTARSTASGAAPAGGVRRVGIGAYEIERKTLDRWLADTTLLARSARIVPAVRKGRPAGFKLYAIRPGSLYQAMGLRNGDTVEQVNGHSITTPDKVLEVYTKVRNARRITLTIRRQRVVRRFRYKIVP